MELSGSESYYKETKKTKKNVMGKFGKNTRIIRKIHEKFIRFTNYSGIIRSMFDQPNNSVFGSSSLKNKLFANLCDYDCHQPIQHYIFNLQIVYITDNKNL